MSPARATWPGKQASLFHAYLSSIAYASLAPTEISLLVRIKIWNLAEAVTCRKISADDLDVAFFENFGDMTFRVILHTRYAQIAIPSLSPNWCVTVSTRAWGGFVKMSR